MVVDMSNQNAKRSKLQLESNNYFTLQMPMKQMDLLIVGIKTPNFS